MTTHRTLWKVTALLAAAALLVLGVREGLSAIRQSTAEKNLVTVLEGRIEAMLAELERDPRARLMSTQSTVVAVAKTGDTNVENLPAEVFYARALLAHYGESDYESAEAQYREAIERRPGWSWPHNGLAVTLFEMGHEDASLAAFERATELAPGWSRPYSDLAILYRLAGRLEEAEEAARKALEVEPDNGATHNNYGVILDISGKEDAARKRYRRAMDLAPELPSPYYNLACSFARNGNAEEAAPLLEQAIQLDEAFRSEAAGDPDFDPIRASPDFVRLVAAGDFH